MSKRPATKNLPPKDTATMYRPSDPYSGHQEAQYTLITPETNESRLPSDLVYFSSDNGSASYAVYLDRQGCMSEDDINKFIQSKNPELFERLLSGRPVAQAPLSRDLDPHPPSDEYMGFTSSIHSVCQTDVSSYNIPPRNCTTGPGSSFQQIVEVEELHQQDLLLLQWKRQVVSSLLNNALLLLRKGGSSKLLFGCASPSCNRHMYGLAEGEYFLTLQPEDTHLSFLSLPSAHFCLICLEDLFADNRAGQKIESCKKNLSLFDGICEDGLVAAAAKRLVTQPREDLANVTGLPFDYPPNSSQAIHLRRKRDIEIEDILKLVERSQKRSTAHFSTNSPSLVITPPVDIGSIHERYKKQGLGASDKKKEQEWNATSVARSRKVSSETGHTASSPDYSKEAICYCREPGKGDDSFKCSSEFCVIGWVHLHCSGLARVPRTGDKWYCRYCSESFKSSIDDSTEDNGDFRSASVHEGEISEDVEADEENIVEDEAGWNEPPVETEFPYQKNHEQEEDEEEDLSLNTPDWVAFSQVASQVKPHSLLDGPPFSPFAQHNPPPAFRPAVLPPGHTKIVFTDLAPFIIAEQTLMAQLPMSVSVLIPSFGGPPTLTTQHIAALDQWKSLCPRSKLLEPVVTQTTGQGQTLFNSPIRAKPTASGTGVSNVGDKQAGTFMKLSAVLADVDRQSVSADSMLKLGPWGV